jgi:uncharacterized protein YciI
MGRRFVYFYLMKEEPDRIGAAVPSHVEFWQGSGLPGYTGGPFADKSGGLVMFEASTLEEATAIANRDPFVVQDVVDSRWVKEWMPTQPSSPNLTT